MTGTTTRPLGRIQRSVLTALAEHHVWPSGWLWANESTTVRVLDSLVKRGLVRHTASDVTRVGTYRITDAGREALR